MSTLRRLFGTQIEAGLIDIIVPPTHYYPDPNDALAIPAEDNVFNDTRERIVWRVMQNYDYSYLMNYCHQRGVFYIQVCIPHLMS